MIDQESSLSSNSSNTTLDTPRTAARETKGRWRCGEVVGSGTAECAAICCCCPCGLMEFLVLGLYKVPAGLCRKAWRKRKRQRIVKKRKKQGEIEAEVEVDRGTVNGEVCYSDEAAEEVVDWEKEMMERFPGTGGFWRSASKSQ